MDEYAIRKEWRKCSKSPAYFIHTYGRIYDPESRDWIPFQLWPAQYDTLKTVHEHKQTVILKARQLGLTWLIDGYALWQMLYQPIATVLLFSRRDDEARHLLTRLKGMYQRLPSWMQARHIAVDNEHNWELSNGSAARAFPTSAGDSYTATFALVDEADLVPDLGRLLGAVKPTIDNGGKLVLLSRSDKAKPNSLFKNIYRAARQGENAYRAVFLPWHVHPKRNAAWYAMQKRDALKNTGSLDGLFEQYPGADEEALAARQLDKRLPHEWLRGCYEPQEALPATALPPEIAQHVPGVKVFRLPEPGRRYVVGMDCAEGLPSSDDSVTDVVDAQTGEQVAHLYGKLAPAVHAAYSARLAGWYNMAEFMIENNNHGWTVIQWIQDNTRLRVLQGHLSKPGWSSTTMGKVILYDTLAEVVQNGECVIHDGDTLYQLQALERGTLRAPEQEHDDKADAFALATAGRFAEREQIVHDAGPRVRIGW